MDLSAFENYSILQQNFEKNYEIIKERFPYVSFIRTVPLRADNIKVFKTKENVTTASLNGKLLHSKIYPIKEALRFARLNNIEENDFVIVYGFGLGYHIRSILDIIGNNGFLYVIECSYEMLKLALMLNDLSDILKKENFFLIAGRNDDEIAFQMDSNVFWGIEEIDEKKKKTVVFSPSVELIPENFQKIKNIFELISFQKGAKHFLGKEMLENFKSNMEKLVSGYYIFGLEDIFEKVPVVLVGAGPSLDNTLKYIKKYEKNSIVMCVDSAFIPLVNSGINPDFVFSVDPKFETMTCFDSKYSIENLVVIPSVNKNVVLDLKYKRIFPVIQKHSTIDAFLGNISGLFPKTDGGGAVSCIMFDIAAKMGFRKIFFAGMDFSFPGWKIYAVMSPEFKKMYVNYSKFNTIESQSFDFVRRNRYFFVKSCKEAEIPTYKNLYSYAKNMEQLLKLHKNVKVFNLFSEGIDFDAVSNIFFEEELESYFNGYFEKEKIFKMFKKISFDNKQKEKLLKLLRGIK